MIKRTPKELAEFAAKKLKASKIERDEICTLTKKSKPQISQVMGKKSRESGRKETSIAILDVLGYDVNIVFEVKRKKADRQPER